MISHGGEVSGFLALNIIFPTLNGAVIMLSNEDGVNFLGPLSRQVAALVFLPDQPPADEKTTLQVRSILEGLRKGRMNRALFTGNANSYFSGTALKDYQSSLSALGKVKSVTRASES